MLDRAVKRSSKCRSFRLFIVYSTQIEDAGQGNAV